MRFLFLSLFLLLPLHVSSDDKLSGTIIGTEASVDYSTGSVSTTVNNRECAFDGDFDTFLKDYYPNELKNKDIEVFFINNQKNLDKFITYTKRGYDIKIICQQLNLNLDCIKKLIFAANKKPIYSSFFKKYTEAKKTS